jgi:hypothetical protein
MSWTVRRATGSTVDCDCEGCETGCADDEKLNCDCCCCTLGLVVACSALTVEAEDPLGWYAEGSGGAFNEGAVVPCRELCVAETLYIADL